MSVIDNPNGGEIKDLQRQLRQTQTQSLPAGDSGHPGTGAFSIQLGDAAYATGDYSVALGQNAGADYYGTGLGPSTFAGASAVAIGDSAIASGDDAVAIGKGANSSHHLNGVAIGHGATTWDDNEFRLGGYGHKVMVDGRFGITTTRTPSSTADTQGNTGDLAWDANYFYVKTAAGWKRSALSTF